MMVSYYDARWVHYLKDTKSVPSISAGLPSAKLTTEAKAQEARWRAEDALHTPARAEEIQGDRKLVRDVKTIAKKQRNTSQ